MRAKAVRRSRARFDVNPGMFGFGAGKLGASAGGGGGIGNEAARFATRQQRRDARRREDDYRQGKRQPAELSPDRASSRAETQASPAPVNEPCGRVATGRFQRWWTLAAP